MAKADFNDDLPVLNEVVETGNESIIKSSRLGREVLQELEELKRESAEPFTIDSNDTIDLSADMPEDDNEEIELMIDDLIDRHITALRTDITQLLERVKKRP